MEKNILFEQSIVLLSPFNILSRKVFGGGSQRFDSTIPDGASRPKQREHRGLQQQEMLAQRCPDETDEARRQFVSLNARVKSFCVSLKAVDKETFIWFDICSPTTEVWHYWLLGKKNGGDSFAGRRPKMCNVYIEVSV